MNVFKRIVVRILFGGRTVLVLNPMQETFVAGAISDAYNHIISREETWDAWQLSELKDAYDQIHRQVDGGLIDINDA